MKKILLIGMIFVLIAGWILSTGLLVVPPRTARVVRYPEYLGSLLILEKPLSFANNTDKTQIYFVWPRIPRTSIGVREESYPLGEPLEASAKIELFELYDLTGNPADKNRFAYLAVSGSFEVTRWGKFLWELDSREILQTMSRGEILTYKVGNFVFDVNINRWFAESVARTILVKQTAERYNLKTAQEIEYFLKVYRPYYWALGVMPFRQIEEELVRNPFMDIFNNMTVSRVVFAAAIETDINNVNWRLSLLENQRKDFYKDLDPAVIKKAESIVADFKDYLKEREEKWPIYYDSEKAISDFLVKSQMRGTIYSPQELYAARVLVRLEADIDGLKEDRGWLNEKAAESYEFFKSLRLWDSKGNDSLWEFAIEKVIQEKSPMDGGDFYTWLKTDGMKYLEEEFQKDHELFEQNFGVKFTEFKFAIEEIIKAPVK